jgi:hypothetical protein
LLIFSATSLGTEFLNSLTDIQNTTGQWFQRSGSVATSICAVVEALMLVRLHRQMRGEPSETPGGTITLEEMRYLSVLQGIALILIVFGTVIWGYGDVLHAWIRTFGA